MYLKSSDMRAALDGHEQLREDEKSISNAVGSSVAARVESHFLGRLKFCYFSWFVEVSLGH